MVSHSLPKSGIIRAIMRVALVVVALLLLAPAALAGLADINKSKLPQDAAILKVYDDVLAVEHMAREWSDTWRFSTPKQDVITRIQSGLEILNKARVSAPENAELHLFAGLLAHYAYNLEIEQAYDIAEQAFATARKLSPADPRPEWFSGIHQCQASHVDEGMKKLLGVEQSFGSAKLAAGFWDDYLYCAHLANMPAHELYANDRLTKIGAPPSKDRDFLVQTTRQRLIQPDPKKDYGSREVWYAQSDATSVTFVSYLFGATFVLKGNWQVDIPDVKNATGAVQIGTGPHPGKTGNVFPNILLLVRPPRPGESLSDFQQLLLRDVPKKPVVPVACPVKECVALEGAKPGMYKAEGDGHFLLTVFESSGSEFPGMMFEKPAGPQTTAEGKAQYFRPGQRLLRFDGRLYYLVLLDTAESVLEKAKTDYDFFLKSLRVE